MLPHQSEQNKVCTEYQVKGPYDPAFQDNLLIHPAFSIPMDAVCVFCFQQSAGRIIVGVQKIHR